MSSLKKIFFISLLFLSSFGVAFSAQAAVDVKRLSGRILLQVEDKGQAWYINPLDRKRYYLGRPDDALLIMRRLGLGISNRDFDTFYFNPSSNLFGRILLKVEDKGQAYYVDPLNHHFYYLGRPIEALNVIRNRGLGISNNDLKSIPVGYDPQSGQTTIVNPPVPGSVVIPPVITGDSKTIKFTWRYNNKDYYYSDVFSSDLYTYYKNLSKVLTFSSDNPPTNLRESYYNLFLTSQSSKDTSIDRILNTLRSLGQKEGFSDDQLAEFILAFIQYIPYDYSKPQNAIVPNYPYETLYTDLGVCSDKTFLAVVLLRRLGYGAAIFDFPDIKHSVVAIACPTEYSTYGSGYCYVETTNYFPVGVIPPTINSGVAVSSNEQLSLLFDTARLGKVEILQKTTGKVYQGMPAIKEKISFLGKLHQTISDKRVELEAENARLQTEKVELDVLFAQVNNYSDKNSSAYTDLVAQYNQKVTDYNNKLINFRLRIDTNNSLIDQYNNEIRKFYQH